MVPCEGLVTRNTDVKYESPIISGKKVMAKVKVFKNRSNFKVKVTRSKIMVPRERPCHKVPFLLTFKSQI